MFKTTICWSLLSAIFKEHTICTDEAYLLGTFSFGPYDRSALGTFSHFSTPFTHWTLSVLPTQGIAALSRNAGILCTKTSWHLLALEIEKCNQRSWAVSDC